MKKSSTPQNYPELYRTLQGHNNSIRTIAFNTSTKQLISASEDNLLYLWNLTKKSIRARKLKGHQGFITSVAFSPSSSLIATASMDHTIRIWSNNNLDNYPSHVIRSHSACVRSVDFSPDSRFLLSASNDKTVKIFNARTRKFKRCFNGHSNWVNHAKWNVDGTSVASGKFLIF